MVGQRLTAVVVVALPAVGLDHARQHHVDPDMVLPKSSAMARIMPRCQAPPFGCAVGHAVRYGPVCRVGIDKHNGASPLFPHLNRRLPRQHKVPADIGVDNVHKLIYGYIKKCWRMPKFAAFRIRQSIE